MLSVRRGASRGGHRQRGVGCRGRFAKAGQAGHAAARATKTTQPAEAAHAWHALRKLLHHRLHLAELRQELVDLGRRGARPTGDTALARTANDLGSTPLLHGHRLDDRLDALELLVVDALAGLARLLQHFADAWQHL